MSKNRKILKILFLISPFVLVPLAIIFRESAVLVGNSFATCITYQLGFYCPGCGNTRAVISLLHGDIFSSIRFNPMIVFSLLILLALYVEILLEFFNKTIKIIPRSAKFWLVLLTVSILFYVLRNFIFILSPSSV